MVSVGAEWLLADRSEDKMADADSVMRNTALLQVQTLVKGNLLRVFQ